MTFKKYEYGVTKNSGRCSKKAALNDEAKSFVLENEKLFRILEKAANRCIGGETLDETIQ